MTLNDTSKENIYKRIGLSVEEIKNTDFDLLDAKLIKPSLIKKYIMLHSYLDRILDLDAIDKKLSRI